MLQNNPNVPSDMQTQLRTALANDAIKLYVLDFDADASDQRFVTNFNVVEQSILSGTTLQIYADANANQVQHLNAFHPPLDQANVALPCRESWTDALLARRQHVEGRHHAVRVRSRRHGIYPHLHHASGPPRQGAIHVPIDRGDIQVYELSRPRPG